MSTRANIILKDGDEEMIFYRHSDGYPEGTMPTLKLFVDLMKKGIIRDNLSQSSGWLIILGAIEYQTLNPSLFPESGKKSYDQEQNTVNNALNSLPEKITDWKVGAYEPTTCIHGDIEYLYTIDLQKKTIKKAKA